MLTQFLGSGFEVTPEYEEPWHAHCSTQFGDRQIPADQACCGHRYSSPNPEYGGVFFALAHCCPLCDLIHTDDLPCVHSGLGNQ